MVHQQPIASLLTGEGRGGVFQRSPSRSTICYHTRAKGKATPMFWSQRWLYVYKIYQKLLNACAHHCGALSQGDMRGRPSPIRPSGPLNIICPPRHFSQLAPVHGGVDVILLSTLHGWVISIGDVKWEVENTCLLAPPLPLLPTLLVWCFHHTREVRRSRPFLNTCHCWKSYLWSGHNLHPDNKAHDYRRYKFSPPKTLM